MRGAALLLVLVACSRGAPSSDRARACEAARARAIVTASMLEGPSRDLAVSGALELGAWATFCEGNRDRQQRMQEAIVGPRFGAMAAELRAFGEGR